MSAVTTEKTRLPGRPRDEQVQAAILRATTDLVAEHGFAALTMEAVALRTGVAKSTVYRRWSNKDELVFDALAELKGPVPVPPGDSVRGDLLYMMQALRRQWTDGVHGRLMGQLAVDGTNNRARYRQFRERLIAPRHAVVLAILARGVDEGLIDAAVDPEWAAQLLVAPVIAAGLTHQKRLTAAQVEFNVDAVLRAIAPR